MNKTWYEKVRAIMRDKKIRQKDLLKVFGVTTASAVTHYLSGNRQPSPAQMKSLCERLGCSLDEIMEPSETDQVQLQVAKIMRSAERAMTESGRQFTDQQKLSIYRVAFSAGLDSEITDEQLKEYLKNFVK